MQRLILLFTHRPWLWLAMLLAATLLAASQLNKLEIHISADAMLPEDGPLRSEYREIAASFGDDDTILVVVEDPDLAAPGRLEPLRQARDRLAQLAFVARVESLFDTPHVKTVDGYLVDDPYLGETAADETAGALRAAAANPLLRGTLISSDGSALALAVVLQADTSDADDAKVSMAVEQAIAPLREAYADAYAVGFPQVRNAIAQRIFDEQLMLLPFAIMALLLALLVTLRHLLDVLTPMVTAAISIVWTFGMMGWLGLPINLLTSTVPILLIVVGSTEDVHLLAAFREAQRSGDARAAAITAMARKMGRTVLLTFFTTSAGFLSVGLSGIEALAEFGLVASIGLLFNFIVTLVFVPAALTLAGHGRQDRVAGTAPNPRWPASYWRGLCKRRWQIMLLTSLVVLAALTGMPRLTIDHNPADSLAEGSRLVDNLADLNQRFAGLESFSVVVESGIQDTFLHARYLGEVAELQQFIRARLPDASVTGFPDYLSLLNNALLESDDAGVPSSNEEINELMLFLDHDRVSHYVTADYSRTRIIVRHDITAAEEIDRLLQDIRAFAAAETDPGLQTRITGDSVLALAAARSILVGQLHSVLLILSLFVVIVAIIFTDLRVGLVAAAPNLLPLALLFGLMGYSEIPLNIGTAMTAAIALGIAVDDTLHFMLRYNRALRESRSQTAAMHETLRSEALPVIATSVALVAGFLVFTLSDFLPVAQFGMLAAFVIVAALIADFVLTPLMISSLRLVTLWDLLSSRARRQIIPQSPLFRDMRPWQIRRFVLSSTLLEFAPGETVFRQGDDSTALYLVMQGAIEITLPPATADARPAVVNQFGAGEIFGDIALLADEPRKTDAVALTPTTLLVFSREAIAGVTQLHPFLASRLFLNLARDVSCRWVAFITRVRASTDGDKQHDDR
jgi:predicted RND superfamily exporter protein